MEELVKRIIEGDLYAFEEFIVDYEKLIYNIAYRMFNNVEDAKDISQEVMIKIYKNISKCTDFSSIKTWVYTITYNTCIDEIRKRKGKETKSIDETTDTGESEVKIQFAGTEPSPEEAFIKKERKILIQNAINKLSQEHKNVIILRDIKELSYDEIANITSLSLGTVKSRIARARKALRDIIIDMSEHF